MCVETQKIKGYSHKIITLENCFKGSKYVNDALKAKKWVKASDWLRMHELYVNGGIYLDADIEILPGKNFDHLLDTELFFAREENRLCSNAVVGSVSGNPIIKKYLDNVTNNFIGAGDMVFEPGIRLFSDMFWDKDKTNITELTMDYFFPYNNNTYETKYTKNTITFHHFLSSWATTNQLPVVSFIIPTLGREEGLKRCLESIWKLNYPNDLKEIIIEENINDTVPVKVAMGLAKSHGALIVYAANDMEFTPDSLIKAVNASKKKGLVSFNSGPVYPDKGNINEHFLIRRDIIDKIGGEIFNTRFHHVGCDNLLWAQCDKLGEAIRCEDAIIIHHHFTKGAQMDDVYNIGWSKVEEDRKILKEELNKLNIE